MSLCEYCELMDREENVIYSDKEIVIAVKDKVATPGQITVFTKEHLTILEMVPEKLLEKCSTIANKVSIAVFESLGAQGTNIIVQNGLGAGQNVPHFGIEIIPRQENDGLNLQWQPRQLMEDEVEEIFKTLKEEAGKIDYTKKESNKKEKEIIKE